MTQKNHDNSISLTEIEMIEAQADAPLTATERPVVHTDDHGGYGRSEPETPPSGAGFWAVFWGYSLAAVWVAAAATFIWTALDVQSLQGLMEVNAGRLAGLAMFAFTPALLLVVCGLLVREAARNAWYASRVDAAVQKLSAPGLTATQEVSNLSSAITHEVERINAALESALARLAAMEEVIGHHADTLEQSASDAQERTEGMLKGLRKERLRLGEVSESLDDKAALIANAISDQSKMVAAAAELAASQATDSERRLRSSIDDLTEAGQVVADKGDLVAGRINERTDGLIQLSDTLKDRSEDLDTAYLRHRERLNDATEALRQGQEKIAAALDFHRAELDVMATTARDGAEAINDATSNSSILFRDSVNQAIDRANELADRVRKETEHAAQEHESALARLVAAAQEARSISDAAISTIEEQADLVAEKVERTNEAAFEAARRSDEAFETRLKDAEKLTSRASQVADDAAESVRRRLEAVLASARAETQTVERQIDSMTQRLGELPEIARDRATEAADSLRRGLDGLNAAAIAAAEEAQEIDAAFQARIRQNYELLSEFMLHMGTVAGGRRTSDLGLNEIPAPLSRTRRRSAEPAPEAKTPEIREEAVASAEEMNTPLEGSEPKEEPRADNSVGFPERGGRKPADPGWRWKELLASMPSDDGDDTARSRRRQDDDER